MRSFHAKALLRGTLPFAFSHRTNILATTLANQLHREYFVAVGTKKEEKKDMFSYRWADKQQGDTPSISFSWRDYHLNLKYWEFILQA